MEMSRPGLSGSMGKLEVRMMRVVAFIGSPRPLGNTAAVVREILAGAAGCGAETKIYDLNTVHFRGCQGCRICKTQGSCILQDDMAEMTGALLAADALVIGSPVYYGQVSGQLKLFMDRWYGLKNRDFSSRLAPGKKCALVFSQGMGDNTAYKPMFDSWARIIQAYGVRITEILVAAGVSEAGDVDKDPAFMARARLAGQLLIQAD